MNFLLRELGWEPLSIRRKSHCLSITYKIHHGLTPDYMTTLCPPTIETMTPYNLRNAANIRNFAVRTSTLQK